MALSRRTGQRFQNSIWPGFVDAMTGLLLVLMFVLTIFMIVQWVLRETISGQANKLDELAVEIAEISEALGAEQRAKEALDSELLAVNTTLEGARAQIERQLGRIALLTSERDLSRTELALSQNRIEQFEAQVAGLISERDGALGQVAELETARDALLTEQEELALALATARDEIDAQAQAARLAASQAEAFEALIEDLRAENAEQAAQAETLQRDLTAAQDAVSAEERQRLLEAEAAAALRARLAEADAELTAMTLSLERERQEAEDTLTLLAAARAAEEDLNAQLAATLLALETNNSSQAEAARLEEELAAVLLELDALRSSSGAARDVSAARIAALETELAAAEAGLATLEQDLTDALTTSSALESALATAEAAALALETERNTISADLTSREGELSQTQSALDETNETLAALEADLTARQQELAGLRTALATRESEIADARATLSARDEEISSNAARLTELETRLANALLAAENQGATLEALQAAEAALGDREAETRDLRSELAAVLAAREAADTEVLDLRSELAAALAAREDSASDLETMRAARDAALAEKEALEAQLEQIELANVDSQDLRDRLSAAIAARLAAEETAAGAITEAQRRETLLAAAREALAEEEEISSEAQRAAEVLNQQLGDLRGQLGELQAIIDDAVARDAASQVQLQSLGSQLNTALARVAAEERRRRELEEAERVRLEAELRERTATSEDLEKFRSEFFGRLRDVLGSQEGVQIVGDRFVFSSEVLFDPGSADLSFEGQTEIAKVAGILQNVADDIPPEINWVIQVDGHTDNLPLAGFGRYRDNWELSQGRALSVVQYMIDALGIPPERLSANGFGQYQPLALGDSPEARAQNRRIELKLTGK